MAPWPEQGNEPKAPDKSCSKSGDSSLSDSSKVNSGTTEDLEVNATAPKSDDKQPEEKNPDVSNLDDGQLKALLDEAITYKRPKDREGKSDLFRELLQEAEADESECGDGRRSGGGTVPEQVVPVNSSRYYSNSNRRRGRRDTAVSERQTRGGSLQNLVHAFNSEFDTSGFGYFSQSSGHSGGVGRRKSKRGNSGRDYSVSVSARQREGGSLPSNVNVGGAGGGMLTLSGLELPPTAPLSTAATAALLFDDNRSYSSKQNKRKELGHTLSANEFTTAMPVHSSTNVSYQTGSDTPNNVSKAEFMVVDLGDLGENGQETKSNSVVVGDGVMDSGGGKGSEAGKLLSDVCNNGVDEELGTELEVIQRETTRVPNYTSRATLEVGLGDCNAKNKNLADHGGDVDTTVAFPLGIIQCEKSGGVVNGVEQSPLQLPSSYNSVKCIVGSPNNNNRDDRNGNANKGSGDDDGKQAENKKQRGRRKQLDGGSNLIESRDEPLYGSTPIAQWRNFYGFTYLDISETVSRLTFHGSKDASGDGKSKSLDENGNAVSQNCRLEPISSNDRKSKQRRTKTSNDRNVIMSQNIEGHRGDKDIESLIKFIESNSEGKSKTKNNSAHSNGPVNFGSKQQRNNVRKEEAIGGSKARREKTIEDGHEEEKVSGKNRVSGKGSKDHRGDKVGSSGGQLKKSNSLEEISKTKLEDLTNEKSGTNSMSQSSSSQDKPQLAVDDQELYGEKNRTADRRSWGTEDGQNYCDGTATVSADEGGSSRKRRGAAEDKRKNDEAIPAVVVSTTTTPEETEFHVVTKKQRRKKRRSSSGGRTGGSTSGPGGLFGDDSRRPAGSQYGQSYYQNRGDSSAYYQRKGFTPGNGSGFPPHDRMVEREGGGVMLYQYRHHRPRSPEHLRRKSTSSMPPSDKSDSSDLDSVHSLPVSSTTPKLTLDQTSTSSGSTPQASYADITRMASSNVSSSSSTQGSCNINTGKWPAMTASKSPTVSSPAAAITTTTTTSTVTTTTVSSTTVSSTITTPNSTSVPAVTPLSLNNPQFITGPRLNIGVPPVSGSKVTANPSSNANSSSPLPVPLTTGEPSTVATSQSSEASVDSVTSSRHRSNPPHPDPRTKKDAMTSTTLDYKVEEQTPREKLQGSAKAPEVLSPSNIIMDNYYPSLEESFVADKVDRKQVGRCNNSVHSSTSGKLSAEENPSSIVVPFNASAENCGKSPRNVDLRVKQQTAESSAESTVIVQRSSSCSTGEPVPPAEVSVATVRSKTGGRKVSAAGSNIVATSSVRPPVIIMDEQEQEATFRENVGTVSELTFGFEVNEQLLLSDGNEVCATSADPPSVLEESAIIASPVSNTPQTEETSVVVPVIPSSAGDDFLARYREPVTQQADDHDRIVTFVGLAWDDVLKEMSTASIQSGGKVQYYNGQ
ncbi:serine-rich adhesin for platelets-like isoform X3 [Periplaneta americana]|uniref:serine-rich adhesin for platelets-like isoform X3 n=1 Tax=Periplaneta americana TaxID=6978 RepID=UPI0037E8402A